MASLLALGMAPVLPVLGTAQAAVTVGEHISAFPDRDMVVAVGYAEGEQLLIEVLRNDVVIGTTQGPAAATPEGVGLEVNHGPLGAPQPGDCWTNYTPDIIGGDVIRVTAVDRVGRPADTMTVKDVAFSGPPVANADGSVSVSGTATPGTSFAVEFRRDKPTPRFRRGPFAPVFEPGTNTWTATFKPSTATSAEGLTTTQQRDIALNEASWLAVATSFNETTLAELGETGGVGPGCNGSADPNTLVGGLQPINIASGDVTFSGTARPGVAAVSVTVGALGARSATVTADPNGGASTWTLSVPKTDLATLPDGGVPVTPRFDTLDGATRTVLKDTVAPAAPTPSVAPGTYSTTQSVALNKPADEGTSKVYWEIGNAAVPDPTELSNLYTAQIAVTSTQTLKGRLFDPAGNPGAVGTFAYTIGTPPAPPTSLTATESTATAGTAVLGWTGASGATGYNVYRNDVKVNATPLAATARSYTDTAAGLGDHSYVVRAVEANGIESLDSNVAAVTIAAPAVPAGLRATPGDAQVILSWTAVAGAARYRVYRDGVALTSEPGTTSFTDVNRVNGTLYEYAIASLDQAGNESARTGVVQATPAAGLATTRTVTLVAADDTMIRQHVATTNYGATQLLYSDGEAVAGTGSRDTSYLRFTIPALAAGESISAADLSLQVSNGTTNGPKLYRTGTTWTESTMTWSAGRPARSSTTPVGDFGSVGTGRVSTPVSGITASGLVSLELYADTIDGLNYDSSETTNDPQLILTIRTP